MSLVDYFPPITELDFAQDCELWGNWLSAYLQPDRFNTSRVTGISISLTEELFFAALPTSWYQRPEVSNDTIVVITNNMIAWINTYWWGDYNKTTDSWDPSPLFTDALLWRPKEKCPGAFCKALGYTGNYDLSGIGVMVAYYIESILATLYLTAFTLRQTTQYFQRKSGRKPTGDATFAADRLSIGDGRKPSLPMRAKTFTLSATNRVLDAFRGSLDEFLGTALLMSVAMLVAALYVSSEKIQDYKQMTGSQALDELYGSALYDVILALLAGSFSVFPVMVIYALMRHPDAGQEGANRKWLRRVMLFVMWALAAAVIYVSPRAEFDYSSRHDETEATGLFCDQRGGLSYWHGLKAAQFLVIGLPLLWLVLTAFVLTGFKIPGLVAKNWVRRWREGWRLTVAWVNLLAMWAILAFLTDLRHRIRETAGGLDESSKWGFGQILALSAWVPVVCEFLYILCFGMVDGLSGHLPWGYKIKYEPADLEFYYPSQHEMNNGGGGGAGAAADATADTKAPLMVSTGGITPSPLPTPYTPAPASGVYNPPAAPPSNYFLPVITPPADGTQPTTGATTSSPPIGTAVGTPSPPMPTTASAAPLTAPTGFETAYDPGALQQQQMQPLTAQTQQGQQQFTYHHHPQYPSMMPSAVHNAFHNHQDPQWQQQHQQHQGQQQQAYNQWHQSGW